MIPDARTDRECEEYAKQQRAPAKDRYCLDQDNDGHWYIVPLDKQQEWQAWLEIDEDDERAWEAPEFANRVYGAPQMVTFSTPIINIT